MRNYIPISRKENPKEYDRIVAKQTYLEWKKFCISYLGGKCKKCGASSNLEIDHINPLIKSISLTKLGRRYSSTFYEELEKCQLLCKECHLLKSITEGSLSKCSNKGKLTHGSSGYRSGCRCVICLEYNKLRNIRRKELKRVSGNDGGVAADCKSATLETQGVRIPSNPPLCSE